MYCWEGQNHRLFDDNKRIQFICAICSSRSHRHKYTIGQWQQFSDFRFPLIANFQVSDGVRLVYDGNSLTTVSFGNYPAIVTNEIVGPLKVSAIDNVAVAGKTTAQLITDALTKVDPLFLS